MRGAVAPPRLSRPVPSRSSAVGAAGPEVKEPPACGAVPGYPVRGQRGLSRGAARSSLRRGLVPGRPAAGLGLRLRRVRKSGPSPRPFGSACADLSRGGEPTRGAALPTARCSPPLNAPRCAHCPHAVRVQRRTSQQKLNPADGENWIRKCVTRDVRTLRAASAGAGAAPSPAGPWAGRGSSEGICLLPAGSCWAARGREGKAAPLNSNVMVILQALAACW